MGERLTVLRGGDAGGFVGIGQVAGFEEDGGSLLETEHAHESGAADATVDGTGAGEECAVEAEGVMEVVVVVAVVGFDSVRVVVVVPSNGGGQAGRGHAVGLDALEIVPGGGGIEVQADEKLGAVGVRDRDPIREAELRVVGAGEDDLPAAGGEEGGDAECPVEGELFFEMLAVDAACAGVGATMTGIDDHDGLGCRGEAGFGFQEWAEVLVEVDVVDEEPVGGGDGGVTEPVIGAVELGDPGAGHEAVGALGTVEFGDGVGGDVEAAELPVGCFPDQPIDGNPGGLWAWGLVGQRGGQRCDRSGWGDGAGEALGSRRGECGRGGDDGTAARRGGDGAQRDGAGPRRTATGEEGEAEQGCEDEPDGAAQRGSRRWGRRAGLRRGGHLLLFVDEVGGFAEIVADEVMEPER